ncbi:MAG: DUF3048 domain-containing protein [Sphingomonadaceae bacterium]
MCINPPPTDRSRGGPRSTGPAGLIAAAVVLAVLLAIAAFGPSACLSREDVASSPTATEGGLGTPAPAPAAQSTRPSTGISPSATLTPRATYTPVPTPGPAHPLAVVVENFVDARPQSGLAAADIVYEALVEGGITRFLAIYIDGRAEAVGPIRSARHYFAYLAAEHDATFVHIGSSPQGYAALDATGVVNLDETYGDPGFWRAKTRYAPHNAYTSTDLLRPTLEKVRKPTPDPWAGFAFRTDSSPIEGPEARELTIGYATDYSAKYAYAPESKLYRRYMDGLPHRDQETDEQVAPRNLVVQFVGAWVIDGEGRLDMAQVGQGKALFFRDGVLTEGRWHKPSLGSVTRWYDSEGKPLLFNPGKIWVQIVPPGTRLDY